jgi:hypothetical protein
VPLALVSDQLPEWRLSANLSVTVAFPDVPKGQETVHVPEYDAVQSPHCDPADTVPAPAPNRTTATTVARSTRTVRDYNVH